MSGLSAVSRELFITGMRQVASSVAVVTTSGPAGRHGATVSAFSSVSADPPQLLICLRSASRIAAAVDTNGAFCLNILSHHHPHVAERFSGTHDSAVADRFEGIETQIDQDGWIALTDATVFACTVSGQLSAGTHTIFLGQVQRVQTSEHDPLTYQQGRGWLQSFGYGASALSLAAAVTDLLPRIGLGEHLLEIGHVLLHLLGRKVLLGELRGFVEPTLEANHEREILPDPRFTL